MRELIDFVQDDDKLREERKKAKKNKDKYIGLSSEAMGYKGTGNVIFNQLLTNFNSDCFIKELRSGMMHLGGKRTVIMNLVIKKAVH